MRGSFCLGALAGVGRTLGLDTLAVAGGYGSQRIAFRFNHGQLAAGRVKVGGKDCHLLPQCRVSPAAQ